MKWLVTSMKWIMLVAGLLTSTMFYYAFAPTAAMTSAFGQALEGPLADLIVRNWGVLVGLVGLMLIYGAVTPPARRLVLSVAVISKAVFILLLLTVGSDFLGQPIRMALVIDGLEVLLFVAYLLATGHEVPARQPTNV